MRYLSPTERDGNRGPIQNNVDFLRKGVSLSNDPKKISNTFSVNARIYDRVLVRHESYHASIQGHLFVWMSDEFSCW